MDLYHNIDSRSNHPPSPLSRVLNASHLNCRFGSANSNFARALHDTPLPCAFASDSSPPTVLCYASWRQAAREHSSMRRAHERALNRSACAHPRCRTVGADLPTTHMNPTISTMRRLARTASHAAHAPSLLYALAGGPGPFACTNAHTVAIFQPLGQPQGDDLFMECWERRDLQTLGAHDRF